MYARGTIVWLGLADPYEGAEAFADFADDQEAPIVEVLQALHTACNAPGCQGKLSPAQVLSAALTNPDLDAALRDWLKVRAAEAPSPRLLSSKLTAIRDAIYDGWRLRSEVNRRTHRQVWWVEAVEIARDRVVEPSAGREQSQVSGEGN